VTEPARRAELQRRLQAVERRIDQACRRSGRDRSDVTLVAVTKSVGEATAGVAVDLGLTDLGESRPQELWRKRAGLPATVRWHLIGHLQRNKIGPSLPVHLIHSVDSERLLRALDQAARAQARPVSILLQVNTSGEASKQGFAPQELPGVVARAGDFQGVRIEGLMTMAPLNANAEHCRAPFAAVRRLQLQFRDDLSPPHQLRHLSMGMSNDFEVAIEEGATLIRLGTLLFDGIEP
jgi:pyridoxal phosphate enzyme (YggS family)